MPLRPVEKVLVSDGILEQIRQMIHSGELSPDQRLPSEIRMAEHLSVSRSSLREALNALIHLGYLQRRNKGTYVAPQTRWQTNFSFHFQRSKEEQNIAEMIEVRKIVEPQLCALAAKRAEPEDLKALEKNLHQMKTQLAVPGAFIDSDHHFHLSIARAAKNSILGDFVEKVSDLLRNNISLIIQKSAISERSLNFHEDILKAVGDGDAPRAKRAMAGHLSDIEKEFLKIIYQPAEVS